MLLTFYRHLLPHKCSPTLEVLPYMINRYVLRRHVRLDEIDRQQHYQTQSRYTDEGGVLVDENDYQDNPV